MPSGFFVAHDDGPNAMRIEVFACLVEQRLDSGSPETRKEAVAQEPARRVPTIRMEAISYNGLAVPHGVGYQRQDAHRHLAKVDVGVANVRLDRDDRLTDIDDAHGESFSVLQLPRCFSAPTQRKRTPLAVLQQWPKLSNNADTFK